MNHANALNVSWMIQRALYILLNSVREEWGTPVKLAD